MFFIGFGNLLPDTFFFARIRAYLLILAGGNIADAKTCIIRKGLVVENASNVFLGSHVQINRDCLITGHAKTELCDGVILSYQVKLLSISHFGARNNQDKTGEIYLGENSILYAGTIVKPGITIGNQVIVGAGSVVTKDLASNNTYAGVPARKIDDSKK